MSTSVPMAITRTIEPETWDDDPDLILPSTPLHLHLSSSTNSRQSRESSASLDDGEPPRTASTAVGDGFDDFDQEMTVSLGKGLAAPKISSGGGSGARSGTGTGSSSDDDRSSNMFSGPGSGDDYGYSSGGYPSRRDNFVRRDMEGIGEVSGAAQGGFGLGPGLGSRADLSGSLDGESEKNSETIRGGTLKGGMTISSGGTTVKGLERWREREGEETTMTMDLQGGLVGEVVRLGSKKTDGMGDWDEDVDLPESLTSSDLHKTLRRPASFASHISDDPSEDDRLLPSASQNLHQYSSGSQSNSSSPARGRIYGAAFPYGRAPRSSGGPSEWDGEDDTGFEDAFDLPQDLSRVSLSPVLSRQRSQAELDRDETEHRRREGGDGHVGRERHSSAASGTASLTDEDKTVSTDDDAFFEDLDVPPFFGGDKPASSGKPTGIETVDLQALLREKMTARAGAGGNAMAVNLALANLAQQQQHQHLTQSPKEDVVRRSDSPSSIVLGPPMRRGSALEDMESGLVIGDGEPLGKDRLMRVRKASRSAADARTRAIGSSKRSHSGSVGSTGSAATVVPPKSAGPVGVGGGTMEQQQKQKQAMGMNRLLSTLRPTASSNNLAGLAAAIGSSSTANGLAPPVGTPNRSASANWRSTMSVQTSGLASSSSHLPSPGGSLLSPPQARTLKYKKSTSLLSPTTPSSSTFGSGGLSPASAGPVRPSLSKKRSMSSLTDTPRSTTPIGQLAGGYAMPTLASAARARLQGVATPDSPVIPPARPSTPNTISAAVRLTLPTLSSRAKVQTPRMTVATGSRANAASPLGPPPSRSQMHRGPSSTGSGSSFAGLHAPTVLRKPRRQRQYGDGTELDDFDDLPTNKEKESKFVLRTGGSRHSSTSASASGSWRTPTSPLAGGPPPSTIGKRPRPVKESIPGSAGYATAAAAAEREREKEKEAKERGERNRKRAASDVRNRREGSSTAAPGMMQSRKKREAKRQPQLIRGLNTAGAPRVEGEMIWNPKLGKWEGNENVLRDFDNVLATSTRPALITQLSGPSPSRPGFPGHFGLGANGGIKVVGDMVFDPIRMSWFARDEGAEDELEFGADFADDEADFGPIVGHEPAGRQSMGDDGWHWGEGARLRTQGSSMSMGSEPSVGDEESAMSGGGVTGIEEALLTECLEAEKRHKEEYRGWTSRRQPSTSASGRGLGTLRGEDGAEDRSWLWAIRSLVME